MSLLSDARRYAREYQRALNLPEWTVTVRIAQVPHGDAGAWATTAANTDYMTAEIQVYNAIPPEELAHTMAHEMLHLVLWPMDQAVRDATEREPKPYQRAEETAINRIAAALTRGA